MVKSVRDARGNVLDNYKTDSKAVLDPRVAYVLTTMMEAVDQQRHRLPGARPRVSSAGSRQNRHLA